MARAKKRTKDQIARADRAARRKALAEIRGRIEATREAEVEVERDALEALPETFDERVLRETEEKKKFDAAAQIRFLKLFALGGTVQEAARAAGVAAITVHRERRRDPEFAKRFQDALELNTDGVEDLLRNLAGEGNVTAIFGILRARRPGVWRETKAVDANVNVNHAASAELFTQLVEALGRTRPGPATSDPG